MSETLHSSLIAAVKGNALVFKGMLVSQAISVVARKEP
jgi:hypothetical protein